MELYSVSYQSSWGHPSEANGNATVGRGWTGTWDHILKLNEASS